MRYTCF